MTLALDLDFFCLRVSKRPLDMFTSCHVFATAKTLLSFVPSQSDQPILAYFLHTTRFNVTPDSFAPPPDPIKRLYQLQHGSLRAMHRGETLSPFFFFKRGRKVDGVLFVSKLVLCRSCFCFFASSAQS